MNVALGAATALPASLVGFVVSSDAPNYSLIPAHSQHGDRPNLANVEKGRQIRDLFNLIKELQAEAEH